MDDYPGTPNHDATPEDYARKAAEEDARIAEESSEQPAESAPDSASEDPRPMRPQMEETNPKVAGPPPVSDQPGLGRAANPPPASGLPAPNLSPDRVGAEIERRRERAAADRESIAASRDEG